MHLTDLGSLATLAIAVILLAGLAWGVREVGVARRLRREAATFEALRALRTPEYARMSQRARRIPARLDAAQAETLDAEAREALAWFVLRYDELGLLAGRGAVDLSLVDDAIGGEVVRFWEKVRPYAMDRRRALASEDICRWTQWLAEELQAERGVAEQEADRLPF